ncbi:MAG: hypothetical protein M0Q43_05415 [Methanothrix sp.]|nr:hypothetical protein [Methanothrix sp.]
MIFPAWLSLNFRYLAWRASQVLVTIIKWLFSGFRPGLFLVLGVASALLIRTIIINNIPENVTINITSHGLMDILTPGLWSGVFSVKWIDILSPDFWMKVFVITAVLLLVYRAIRSRKRIILLQFTNQTGDEKLKSSVEGISSGLQNELSRLVRLCTQVDDTNPFSPGTQTMSSKESKESASIPNISVSIGESLKSIVSSETKVKLGPLEIPVGATIGVLAKVMEGPQLTGSLLEEDGSLVLIANLSGGGHSEDWRISISDLEEKDTTSAGLAAQMTHQLTYRIFTSLVKDELGSPSRKAVFHYVKGLSAYRDTLRTDRDKSPKLRQAEKEFLLALGEDKKFLQCYYNLGVVYSALGQPESAISVLNKSIDPDQTETYLSNVYYALAGNHYWIQSGRGENADNQSTINLCERAIDLQPAEAKNWNMLGRILYAEVERNHWKKEIISAQEIATALAWREMCCCASERKKIDNLKAVAKNCTWYLAYYHANLSSGKPYYEQAIHLAPSDADLYYDFGLYLNYFKRYEEAAIALKKAVKIRERPAYWNELAVAYANLAENDEGKAYENEKLALDACRHVMDCSSESENVELKPEKAMYKLMLGLLSLLSNNINVFNCRSNNWNWDFAEALLRLAGLSSVNDDGYARAKELNNSTIRLKKALDALEDQLNQMNGAKKEDCCKLNDPAKSKLKKAIEDIKSQNPRMAKISTLSPALYLDNAWHDLSLAEQSIDSDRSFQDINEYFKAALSDFRENLFPHALVINTLNQLEQGETECNEQYKVRLEELAKRLSIWDWGHDKVLFKLNESKGISYEDEGKSPRLELVSELLENLENNKNRTKLEELRQRQLDGRWDWGHVQVLIALSQTEQKDEKKEELLEEALSILEKNSSSEVADKGVYGMLAKALINQKIFGRALQHAQHLVALSPENSWNRGMLSYVYQNIGSFQEAESQLKICNALSPEDPIFMQSIGSSQQGLAPGVNNKENREKSLRRYIDRQRDALELLMSEGLERLDYTILNRSRTSYCLGWAYYELSEFDDAISHFIVAKNLLNDSSSRSDLIIKLRLSDAYLMNKSFKEAEYELNGLINEILGLIHQTPEDSRHKAKGLLEFVGDEIRAKTKVSDLLTFAYLYLASSFVERDAIDPALKCIEHAEEYIKYTSDSELEALLADCKGWIIYKQARQGCVLDISNDINESINCLKEAVSKSASAKYYLHLAMALECKLETDGARPSAKDKEGAERQRILRYALACCDHVKDLDNGIKNSLTERANELQKRLEKSEEDNKKASSSKEGDSKSDSAQGYV